MSKSQFGYQLYRWHAWVGLISGLFLLVICVTGSIAVFRPEIERAVDWGSYDFDVQPVGEPITLEQAITVAREKYPRATVSAANYPALPGSTMSHGPCYSIVLAGGKGVGTINVLVDPYRATVVAEMKPNSGWGNWLRQLHVRFLYFSFWGRYIVGIFGLTLLFSTITGLVIFARFNANSWLPRIRRGRGARILLGDVHKVVGLSTVAFNLMFGVTGAVLGLEGVYYKYLASKPPQIIGREMRTELEAGVVASCVQRATELVANTRPAGVDLILKNGLLRVRLEHSTAALIKEHQSSVLFNATTRDVVGINDATTGSAAARAYYAIEPLHFGRLNGALWVKLIWGIVGLSGGALSISGYAIYVLRRFAPRKRAIRVTAGSVISDSASPQLSPAAQGFSSSP